MKKLFLTIIIIASLILFLFFVRLLISKEIDDISPEIQCEQKYLEKSAVLWVIPKFNNKPISENLKWCKQILNLNKTLGLHGVTHEFEEFVIDRDQKYFNEGIQIFEKCFGFKPTMFKPPQLKISNENKKLIEDNNMKIKAKTNQITHKIYHCGDTGKFSNWIINLF